jgi:uncharacterized SAM-binding protein YcdF (DUF218 family)
VKLRKKNIKSYIFFLIGLLGILDTIFVRFYVQGMDLGTMLPAIIGIVFIAFAFKPLWEKYLQKVNLFFRRMVYWGFLVFLTVFIVALGCIILGGLYTPEPTEQPEYVIILGAGIKGDGSPTLTLERRLEAGIAYARQHPDTYIVVSGGQGSNEPMPEGHAMARYLKDRGVDPQRIVIEDRSSSTMENFRYSKELIGEQKEIVFITNKFHVFRSTILARRNGFKAYGYGTETPGIVLINSYLREIFALGKSLIFDF